MEALPYDRTRRGACRPLTPDEKDRIIFLYRSGLKDPERIRIGMNLPHARKTIINVLNDAGIFLRRHHVVLPAVVARQTPFGTINVLPKTDEERGIASPPECQRPSAIIGPLEVTALDQEVNADMAQLNEDRKNADAYREEYRFERFTLAAVTGLLSNPDLNLRPEQLAAAAMELGEALLDVWNKRQAAKDKASEIFKGETA